MKKKLINLNNALVLVVGDIILDSYWYSKNHYKLFEKFIPIVPIQEIQEQPGGAANVAKNIAKIGGDCKIIGYIGMDNEGMKVKKLLNHIRINQDLIAIKNHKTITKIRILSDNKQLIRIDLQEKYLFNNENLLYQKIINSLSQHKILVLSDYAKGTLMNIPNIIHFTKKMSIPILIDPKGINFEKYSGASLLTPNLSEFEKIVGKCYQEDEILDRGMKLLYKLKLSALLITRSKDGMTLFQYQKKPIHFPASSHKAYDVTGAGDTVIAIIAASLAKGYSLEESCFYANIGAGIVIKKIGTETLTIHELNTALNCS
ncbi:D-glycero-beta-D-manno-heptose-7-phosphate kinase [Buchnera aphidicola (Macrosiphoniella sanborni)]|uniref:D-glycero-beta-D-manno-heptose-7-phosphate kinase n=1 Tax=Buchnera aphidicola (Macrosiphoniella sanborni) TaxID=1241865 RepID=A0A4D6YDA2_9GAMM|nr:D-glycero-beta-D-manno-heptose-7-phosphate kinase [Buchnera aphidicola]QCI23630.1 D-glycero-beta-D-manno-heptose-7-phosphate kinase [Buchnera aphidicola (Macrosiphoniella sanborni)]